MRCSVKVLADFRIASMCPCVIKASAFDSASHTQGQDSLAEPSYNQKSSGEDSCVYSLAWPREVAVGS